MTSHTTNAAVAFAALLVLLLPFIVLAAVIWGAGAVLASIRA
jgi:hypothetical protein